MKRQPWNAALTTVAALLLTAPSVYLASVSLLESSKEPWVSPDRYVPLLPLMIDRMPVKRGVHRCSFRRPLPSFLTNTTIAFLAEKTLGLPGACFPFRKVAGQSFCLEAEHRLATLFAYKASKNITE